MGHREIPLSKGQVALVDEEDYERVSQLAWHAQWNKYTQSYYAKHNYRAAGTEKSIFMHSFLMGTKADHENHDTLDNRRSNLRPATYAQNAANRRLRRDSASGYKGVSRHGLRWRAKIQCEGKRIHLGMFDDPIDAAKAYDIAAKEIFGEFAHLNFPEET